MPIINDRIITFMVNGRVFTANSVNEFQDFVRRQTGDHTINVADHFPHLQPEAYDDNGNRQDQGAHHQNGKGGKYNPPRH